MTKAGKYRQEVLAIFPHATIEEDALASPRYTFRVFGNIPHDRMTLGTGRTPLIAWREAAETARHIEAVQALEKLRESRGEGFTEAVATCYSEILDVRAKIHRWLSDPFTEPEGAEEERFLRTLADWISDQMPPSFIAFHEKYGTMDRFKLK